MIPIITGAFGFVPNDLKESLGKLNFDEKKRVLLENSKPLPSQAL